MTLANVQSLNLINNRQYLFLDVCPNCPQSQHLSRSELQYLLRTSSETLSEHVIVPE